MKKTRKSLAFLTILAMLVSLCAAPAFAGANLITNGDFEGGNTGFDTEYTYLDPANTGTWTLGPEYMYTVSTNPHDYHSAWAAFGDHTSGTGKMMIVNGTYLNQITRVVWSQDVSLEAAASNSEGWELWAGSGQKWNVGMAYISNTEDKICVRLVLNHKAVNGNFKMTEVHLAIGDSLADIPQTKNGNPIPGQFPVHAEFDPGVYEYEYCFDNEWDMGTELFIATHAVMERPEISHMEGDIKVIDQAAQSETLWGNCNPFPGKNWARFIRYTTQASQAVTYRLTFWARSTYPDAPAILQVKEGETVLGTLDLTSDTTLWSKFQHDFTVPADTDTKIEIRDLRLVASGDDFCIDDISLEKLD
ncbi:MAG TPA: hypothetical protein DIT32_06550 [Peptococcaceae bacterium]|nr:hypothetical protein [Peptococcaceae bacterium]